MNSTNTYPTATATATTAEPGAGALELAREEFRRNQLVPLCIIIVVGSLANVTVICNGMMKRVRFKHYSNYFILSLAFADLGVVLMAIPINIVEYTKGLNISQTTCAFVLPIRETFQNVAMQTVAVLGLARLTQITKAYRMPTSKRGSLLLVIAIWVNSYLLISLPMGFVFKIFPETGICDPVWKNDTLRKIHLTFTTTMLCLPMITVTVSYLIILTKIKSLWRFNSGGDNNVGTNANITNNDERTTRKSRNLLMLLVMLIIVCWVSYAPLALIILLGIYDEHETSELGYCIITVLFYSSSAIDPLLILMMSRDYRFRLPRKVSRKRRVANVHDQNLTAIQNQKNSPK